MSNPVEITSNALGYWVQRTLSDDQVKALLDAMEDAVDARMETNPRRASIVLAFTDGARATFRRCGMR